MTMMMMMSDGRQVTVCRFRVTVGVTSARVGTTVTVTMTVQASTDDLMTMTVMTDDDDDDDTASVTTARDNTARARYDDRQCWTTVTVSTVAPCPVDVGMMSRCVRVDKFQIDDDGTGKFSLMTEYEMPVTIW